MAFNIWTFLFQLVNFVVLVYLLRRLLYRPLREAIDHRRETTARALADAEAARREAAALKETLDQKLADLDRAREAAMRDARDRAEADRQALTADAEAAIRRRREEAEQQLARERDDALSSLQGELVQSAVELVERFLHEVCGATVQQQLAGHLVDELRRISDDERTRLRAEWADGESAVLESAAALNGDVLHDLGGAVEMVAGRPLAVSVQVRPELLGGVRLRIGGHVWDASMAGCLEDIRPDQTGSHRS